MANEKNVTDKAKDFINNVEDSTSKFDSKEIESGKGMGILSYIFPPVPFFVEKNNKFVIYHAKQGMNLFIVAIVWAIVSAILTAVIKVNGTCGTYWGINIPCKVTPIWITIPVWIITALIGVLCILGILNVCKGKAKELPVINKIKIFK